MCFLTRGCFSIGFGPNSRGGVYWLKTGRSGIVLVFSDTTDDEEAEGKVGEIGVAEED
jgi:hypothetical protein